MENNKPLNCVLFIDLYVICETYLPIKGTKLYNDDKVDETST